MGISEGESTPPTTNAPIDPVDPQNPPLDINLSLDSGGELDPEDNHMKPGNIWRFFQLEVKNVDGSSTETDEFLDFDVAEIAIHKLGIPAYDLSHISAEMGPGRAVIGSKTPVDIVRRLGNMALPFVYSQVSTGKKFLIDIRGLKSALGRSSSLKFKIVALRYVLKASEEEIIENPAFKDGGKSLGSSNLLIEVEGDPKLVPPLLPVGGRIIKLEFERAKKQCSRCFGFGHTISRCQNDRSTLKSYKATILKISSATVAKLSLNPGSSSFQPENTKENLMSRPELSRGPSSGNDQLKAGHSVSISLEDTSLATETNHQDSRPNFDSSLEHDGEGSSEFVKENPQLGEENVESKTNEIEEPNLPAVQSPEGLGTMEGNNREEKSDCKGASPPSGALSLDGARQTHFDRTEEPGDPSSEKSFIHSDGEHHNYCGRSEYH